MNRTSVSRSRGVRKNIVYGWCGGLSRFTEVAMPGPTLSVDAVHRTFKTTDPDAAHEYVEQTFAEHRMVLYGRDGIRFRLDSAATPTVTVGRMAYGKHARIAGPAMRDCYHVSLLVSGSCAVEQSGRRADFGADGDRRGVIFGPDEPVLIDWSADAAQYHMKISRRALEEHAAKLAGRPVVAPIEFGLTFPLDDAAGRSLCSAMAFYYQQLAQEGGLATMRAVQREFESALMTQVLLVACSDLTPVLNLVAEDRDADARIRDVMDYIRASAQNDLTVDDLAQVAGVTVRTLQSGFRRSAGVTPSEFIRNVRLDGARGDLLAGNGQSVSDIASRWQFHHLGRFAQQYRRRFGDSPSQTLRSGAVTIT
ncbi:AraC family transcriptional regulator [Streptomyces sp. NPDC058247]|uniref:AraC family transcriptional regulator n=1 Tax=Streptomyces sp. NPDC058247 TaxID=3346401 RepID=UPI0036F0C865